MELNANLLIAREKICALEKELENRKESHLSFKISHAAELESLKQNHASESMALKEHYEKKISSIKNNVGLLEKQIESLKECNISSKSSLTAELEFCKTSHAAELESLKQNHASESMALKEDFEKKISFIKKQVWVIKFNFLSFEFEFYFDSVYSVQTVAKKGVYIVVNTLLTVALIAKRIIGRSTRNHAVVNNKWNSPKKENKNIFPLIIKSCIIYSFWLVWKKKTDCPFPC